MKDSFENEYIDYPRPEEDPFKSSPKDDEKPLPVANRISEWVDMWCRRLLTIDLPPLPPRIL